MNRSAEQPALPLAALLRGARRTGLAACALALCAGLAFADPGVRVSYARGTVRIELEGDWPNTRYTVLRSTSEGDLGAPLTELNTLCLGPCFAEDRDAEPGRTYWYRFHLVLPDGNLARFGPYPVTIAPAAARFAVSLSPNPFRAGGAVEVFVAGRAADGPVAATVDLLDLQGRRVKTFVRGALARGTSRIAWDGRGDDGRALGPGAYFLRISSPSGTGVTRVLHVR